MDLYRVLDCSEGMLASCVIRSVRRGISTDGCFACVGYSLVGGSRVCLSRGCYIFSVKEDSRYEDNPFGFVLRCRDVPRG